MAVSYLKVTTYAVHPWGGGTFLGGGGEILVEDQIDLCFRVVMIASLHDRFWGGAGLVSSRCQCFQLAQGADGQYSLILVRNSSLHDQICSKDGTHS